VPYFVSLCSRKFTNCFSLRFLSCLKTQASPTPPIHPLYYLLDRVVKSLGRIIFCALSRRIASDLFRSLSRVAGRAHVPRYNACGYSGVVRVVDDCSVPAQGDIRMSCGVLARHARESVHGLIRYGTLLVIERIEERLVT